MNFENMPELTATKYPLLPGVHVMWAVLIVVYSMLFIGGFHYRIFHAAL